MSGGNTISEQTFTNVKNYLTSKVGSNNVSKSEDDTITNDAKSLLTCLLIQEAPANAELCPEFQSIFPADIPLTHQNMELQKLNKIQFRYVGVFISGQTGFANDNLMLSYLINNYVGKHLGEKVEQETTYEEYQEYQISYIKRDKNKPMMTPVARLCATGEGDNMVAPDLNHTITYVPMRDALTEKFICYKVPSYQKIIPSISPAINRQVTDFNYNSEISEINENTLKFYSTFAESMWDPNSFEFLMFYSATGNQEVWHFVLGVLMFVSFYGVNWFVTDRSDLLFGVHF